MLKPFRADAAGRGSTLGQPRLAQAVNTVLDILGGLEDQNTFPAFNCEPGVDSQHLPALSPRLLKLSRLRIGGGQKSMRPLQVGQARCAFAEKTHRLPIALERVI